MPKDELKPRLKKGTITLRLSEDVITELRKYQWGDAGRAVDTILRKRWKMDTKVAE